MKKKPCPFCGTKGKSLVYADIWSERLHVATQIICLRCNTKGPTNGIGKSHALQLWNNRIERNNRHDAI